MIDHNTLIPECYGDTIFFRMLTSRLGYAYQWEHMKGCNEVARKMEEKRFKTSHLIGIVDNDKVKPRTIISDFTIVSENNFFIIKRKPDTNHFCMLIKNEIEQWLLDSADFEHKYNVAKLAKEMKQMNAEKNNDLKGFINTIIQRNPTAIQELSKWLRDFLKQC